MNIPQKRRPRQKREATGARNNGEREGNLRKKRSNKASAPLLHTLQKYPWRQHSDIQMIAPSSLHIIDATTDERRVQEAATVCQTLRQRGCAIVRVVDDPATLRRQADEFASLRHDLSPAHATPSGARSMGGITKYYGAGVDPRVMQIRLQPAIRHIFALIHQVEPDQLAVSVDAVALLGVDAQRPRRRASHAESARKAYLRETGGALEAHVDISPRGRSAGVVIEEQLAASGGFGYSVQGQYVVEPVCEGGAAFVYAEGDHTGPRAVGDFVTGSRDDFTPLSEAGYERYSSTWKSVEQIPGGVLILWLSRTPHGNKLASFGAATPKRGGVFVCWMPRALSGTREQQNALRKRKLDAALEGRTGDHWPNMLARKYGGAHYSNQNGKTNVLYGMTKGQQMGAPPWSENMRADVFEAL